MLITAIRQTAAGGRTPDNSTAARLKDPPHRDQVRKGTAALYRRGHSWEDIRAALRRFDAEPEEY